MSLHHSPLHIPAPRTDPEQALRELVAGMEALIEEIGRETYWGQQMAAVVGRAK